MPENENSLDELHTLRDFLRCAVSRFNQAELVYGHGTDNAYDEAAFLVLEALHLPIDNLDPFLDARLQQTEKLKLAALIEARVTTRKPLPYLLNKAYIQGVPFYVDERVIVPRSYIGELMASEMFAGGMGSLVPDPASIESVLDLCTGSGCLAILAAMRFENAKVCATDLSKPALEVAKVNVAKHFPHGRVRLFHGDLFAPIRSRTFDLIIANPPYVAEAEAAAFDPEHSAEPLMAHVSGADGFELTRRILNDAEGHLNDDGLLICEIGTGRDLLAEEFPDLPFLWLDTQFSEGEVFALTKDALSGI